MTRSSLVIPLVILAVIVLLTAAIGPAADAGLADVDRIGDGSGMAPNDAPGRTTFVDDVSSQQTATVGTADRLSTTVVDPSGDRFTTPSDQFATPDWTPPVALLLFGYTRQADGAPLDNDNRERVFNHVRSAPGAHIAAIVDETEIPRSTVRYHLRVLEESGLLAGGQIRGRHRYAAAGVDLELAAALYDEPTRAVLETVARFEPVSLSELAEEVDRTPSTVAHHLDHLEEAGLLARESSAGRAHVRLEVAAPELGTNQRTRVSESVMRAGLPAE